MQKTAIFSIMSCLRLKRKNPHNSKTSLREVLGVKDATGGSETTNGGSRSLSKVAQVPATVLSHLTSSSRLGGISREFEDGSETRNDKAAPFGNIPLTMT